MSWRANEVATCGRTTRIAEALLDGAELATSDRLHLAGCAACSREAERTGTFLRRLTVAAEVTMDELPVGTTDVAARPLRALPRVRAAGAMLAGAVAAGLLVAAVVGLRLNAPAGQVTTIGSAATAEVRLNAMDLACIATDSGTTCESVAPDHVHRVRITAEGGAIRAVEAGIIGTTGDAIDLRGADDLLRRLTVAALEGPYDAAATAWLASSYAGCRDTCSAEVDGMHLQLERRDDAAILTIEGR
jgi:hypothetical protein